MASEKQVVAAHQNVKRAQDVATSKGTIAHLPTETGGASKKKPGKVPSAVANPATHRRIEPPTAVPACKAPRYSRPLWGNPN